MEIRTILAIILSVFIWTVWQQFEVNKINKSKPPIVEKVTSAAPENSEKQKVTEITKLEPKPEAPSKMKIAEQLYAVETPYYIAVFSNDSSLKQWTLRKFNDSLGKDAKHIELVEQTIPQELRPLQSKFTAPKYEYLSDIQYQVLENKNKELVFSYKDNNISVTKKYFFTEEKPYFDYEMTIREGAGKLDGNVKIALSAEHTPSSGGGIFTQPDDFHEKHALIYSANEFNSISGNDLSEEKVFNSAYWVGISNRYFLSSLINQSGIEPNIIVKKQNQIVTLLYDYPLLKNSETNQVAIKMKVFLGPKEMNLLESVDETLVKSLDFGNIIGFLCVILLKMLKFFYSFFHNYGVAIILLTIIMRVITYPLQQKSINASKAMQRLQPQIQKLKEKYKDDKEQFNKEMLNLMRTNKVNPAGGCLPMLLQMPIWFALYRILYNAVELYHAPFVFWINDLSAKDPYYVTPLLMGIALFFQQKLTPTPGMDPAQQKMMMFMPIMFSFFMLGLPSGLTLYILVSTVLGVLQQYYMMQKDTVRGTPQPVLIKENN